jgi:dTDP-glucose 4,6-dehydratase
MKIIITGGYGFIGSNFILKQLKNKNIVLNIDKLTYAGNINNLKSIKNNTNYSFINEDICNYKAINKIINDFSPDIVVHFAAESHVDRSIDNPFPFVETNILGTTSLLESCLKYCNNKNVDFKFIHISTDEVFGSLPNHGFFNESTPYDPSSPYSASKASSDHLVRAWHKTYNLPTIITNCSNNYGPYQFPEKLIPLIITNCIDGKTLPVYGNGENIRDWLYVEDHCNAIDIVIKNGRVGETYNIGGSNEISNIDIVNAICTLLDEYLPKKDSYSSLISYVEDRPGHDMRYAIDASKLKNELNWVPKETFDSGIRKTIEWYLNNESWWRDILNNNYNKQRLGLDL